MVRSTRVLYEDKQYTIIVSRLLLELFRKCPSDETTKYVVPGTTSIYQCVVDVVATNKKYAKQPISFPTTHHRQRIRSKFDFFFNAIDDDALWTGDNISIDSVSIYPFFSILKCGL